jgi:hypothetical protein
VQHAVYIEFIDPLFNFPKEIPMLKKLIVFAITSGLAAKAWKAYSASNAKKTATAGGVGKPVVKRSAGTPAA